LSTAQRRVMTAIEICRTAALGGHVEQCDNCAHQRICYSSCLMGKISNGESGHGPSENSGRFQA
jgi:radical SAM protein with 4Fe4S-binding SPASM domain